MPDLMVNRVITPSELHSHTGRLLREHYRDGATLAVRDRWGEVIAVIVIGPELVAKIIP
jgi:hypothetical protein